MCIPSEVSHGGGEKKKLSGIALGVAFSNTASLKQSVK